MDIFLIALGIITVGLLILILGALSWYSEVVPGKPIFCGGLGALILGFFIFIANISQQFNTV